MADLLNDSKGWLIRMDLTEFNKYNRIYPCPATGERAGNVFIERCHSLPDAKSRLWALSTFKDLVDWCEYFGLSISNPVGWNVVGHQIPLDTLIHRISFVIRASQSNRAFIGKNSEKQIEFENISRTLVGYDKTLLNWNIVDRGVCAMWIDSLFPVIAPKVTVLPEAKILTVEELDALESRN